MSGLNCTFGEFVEVLLQNGFVLHRHGATSHRRYRGVVDDRVRFVDVAGHKDSDRPKPGTLASMIRQSGLPKSAFRR